jgi:hypothetical protein
MKYTFKLFHVDGAGVVRELRPSGDDLDAMFASIDKYNPPRFLTCTFTNRGDAAAARYAAGL